MPTLPQRMDRYQIRALLGAGTFGSVYRAYDPKLEREVALKVLRPEMTASPQALERFLREAKAAAKLHHPHIVPVYDTGCFEGAHFIVSAFISGRTLASAIPEGGMESRRAAALAAQLASALGYAHRQGLVHRDVKPANAMLDAEGSLHLMDFGLAGWTQQEQEPNLRLTRLGAVIGTPAYMAPEQAAGDTARVGPASDVYSAGVVLYELLTGRRPFEGARPEVLPFLIARETPAPPSQHRPGLDAGLEAICLKAMAKDPSQRYSSGQEMAAALTAWTPTGLPLAQPMATPSGAAPRPPSPGDRTRGRTLPGRPDERTAHRPRSVWDRETILPASPQATVRPPATPKVGRRPGRSQRGRSSTNWVLWGGALLAVLAGLAVAAVVCLFPPRRAAAPPSAAAKPEPPPNLRPVDPLPPPEVTFPGTFVGAEKGWLTATVDSQARTFAVPDTATVTIDGKPGQLEDVKGASVLTITAQGGMASKIEATSPAPPRPPKLEVVAGTVVGVDKDRLTVSVDGKEKTFTVPNAAKVLIDDKEGKLNVVQKDSVVAVATKDDVVLNVVASSLGDPPPFPWPAPLDCTGEKGVSAAEVRKAQEGWAKYLGRKVEEEDEITVGVKMKFVLFPPGKFLMGSPVGEKERNTDEVLHDVELTQPFYLGMYDVTRGQFRRFVEETKYKTEAESDGKGGYGWEADTKTFVQNPKYTWRDAGFAQTDEHPVVNVSWNDVVKFCEWVGANAKGGVAYRLPTEAEWEYSSRGMCSSSKNPFGIGDSLSSREANFDGDYPYGGAEKGPSLKKTTVGGTYKSNASGLYDMQGNVWQWCRDWYGDYPTGGKVTDPAGPSAGSSRVVRGGGWSDLAKNCRAAHRYWIEPRYRYSYLGFRLARVPPSDPVK